MSTVVRRGPLAALAALALIALVFSLSAARTAHAAPVALPSILADQQDVETDASGNVNVRFDQGDEPPLGAGNNTCMSRAPIVTVQLATTLTPGKAQVFKERIRFNTSCSFRITFLDARGAPIPDAVIRFGYHAIVKGAIVIPV